MSDITILDRFKGLPGVLGVNPQLYRWAATALQRRVDGSNGYLPAPRSNDLESLRLELMVAENAKDALCTLASAYAPQNKPFQEALLEGIDRLAGQVRLAQSLRARTVHSTPVTTDPAQEGVYRESVLNGKAQVSLSQLLWVVALDDKQYIIYSTVPGYIEHYSHSRAYIHAIDITHRALLVPRLDDEGNLSTAVSKDSTVHISGK